MSGGLFQIGDFVKVRGVRDYHCFTIEDISSVQTVKLIGDNFWYPMDLFDLIKDDENMRMFSEIK